MNCWVLLHIFARVVLMITIPIKLTSLHQWKKENQIILVIGMSYKHFNISLTTECYKWLQIENVYQIFNLFQKKISANLFLNMQKSSKSNFLNKQNHILPDESICVQYLNTHWSYFSPTPPNFINLINEVLDVKFPIKNILIS